ncbi:MAG TPA: glycosyltransferase, partial [Iamia sp.]|nr:glycosyltransferase [Iamia sp.]
RVMSALRVAMVPAGDRPTQNPSVVGLAAALADLGVEVRRPRPLPRRGTVDVLHHHWPAADGQRGHVIGAALRLARVLATTVAHRVAGARVVWTAHNVVSHDARFPRLERAFWPAYTRLVDGWIVLSHASAEVVRAEHGRLRDVPGTVIPIGHMVGVCGPPAERGEARRHLDLPADRRVVAHVGRIRPYKGVPALVDAFAALDAEDATLLVAGDLGDPDVEPAVDRARAAGADVRLTPGRVDDAGLARILAAADVVAYPFTRIMNSGAVVLALSYGRPVLASSSPSLRELREAVGGERLRLLDGPVRAADLTAALDAAPAGTGPPPTAELGEWPAIGAATLELYAEAGAGRPRRRGRRS